MLTFNEDKIDRIAKSLEKMAGIDPNPPAPPVPSGGGGTMMVTFTITSEPEEEGGAYIFTSDKSVGEIVEAVKYGVYVYGAIELQEDASYYVYIPLIKTEINADSQVYSVHFEWCSCSITPQEVIRFEVSTINFSGEYSTTEAYSYIYQAEIPIVEPD